MKNSFFIQKYLFIMSLISSIFICLSSSSLLMIWMSMEINLFSFIPLMSINQISTSEKSTMMYFMVQSISSSIIITALCFFNEKLKSMLSMLLFLAIFMKLGMFPFHYWMISMMEGTTWKLAFLVMTIQKIIPISALMLFSHQKTIILFCFLNSLIVSISGMTLFSTRKIMGLSSVNHLSIMLIAMILSKKTFKMYFLIYSFMTLSATKILNFSNSNFLFQTLINFKSNKMNNMIFLITFMSMAGIPPMIGFMPKMFTMIMMMKMNMIFMAMIILILNIFSTYFYLRMSINNMLMNMNKKKTIEMMKNAKMPFYMVFTPIFILFMWNFKLKKLLIFKIKNKSN